MKAALIPPIPGLPLFGHGDFHLLLSDLLDNHEYFNHYMDQRTRGAYLVLDNSAHENGTGNDPEKLMFQACRINAQEVVVPDVLDNADETIECALRAHETWYEKRLSTTEIVRDKALMYVPQGKDHYDWLRCLRELVRIHLFMARRYELKQSFVIGVSKDYEVWDGGLMRLLDDDLIPLRQDLLRNGIRMQCHMLGWGRKLWDLAEIARKHTWIRSTDSAKPFVYAHNAVYLGTYLEDSPPPYPGRSFDYFHRPLTPRRGRIAQENVELFQALAEGRQVL